LLKISSNTAKLIFLTQCKLIINNVEKIIAGKLELFKNPIIDYINQEIRAGGEINNLTSAIVSAP
jgi:hypothetical protein